MVRSGAQASQRKQAGQEVSALRQGGGQIQVKAQSQSEARGLLEF